jgi:hypothetical protein
MPDSEQQSGQDQPTEDRSYGALIKELFAALGEVIKTHVKEWGGVVWEPFSKLKKGCIGLAIAANLFVLAATCLVVAGFLALAALLDSYAGALAIVGAICIIVGVIILKVVFKKKPSQDATETDEQDED